MHEQSYQPVEQDYEGYSSDTEGSKENVKTSSAACKTICLLAGLLFVSLSLNLILLLLPPKPELLQELPSKYVGLHRNVPTRIPHDSRTIDDKMWEDPTFDTFIGMVALQDGYTKSKGLLPSQRWPWDHSKGIYVLHGYHSLHCVFVIRQTIIEYRDQKTLTWAFSHVTHCLHVLREDTICSADDLPRYTGRLHDESNHTQASSGTGAVRMCRDWNKLRDFAIENSACYRWPAEQHLPLLDRYKSCPDRSKPWVQQD